MLVIMRKKTVLTQVLMWWSCNFLPWTQNITWIVLRCSQNVMFRRFFYGQGDQPLTGSEPFVWLINNRWTTCDYRYRPNANQASRNPRRSLRHLNRARVEKLNLRAHRDEIYYFSYGTPLNLCLFSQCDIPGKYEIKM